MGDDHNPWAKRTISQPGLWTAKALVVTLALASLIETYPIWVSGEAAGWSRLISRSSMTLPMVEIGEEDGYMAKKLLLTSSHMSNSYE